MRNAVNSVDSFVVTNTGGQMFVLSKSQLRKLLQCKEPIDGTLLDIGAGDGNITERLQTCVKNVITTEISRPMVARLKAHGFRCVKTADLNHSAIEAEKPFHLIR